MKLRDLIEAVRGLDDKGFLERFPHPFLLEEGLLRHETRSFAKNADGVVNSAPQLEEIAERQTFPIRRRDGKGGDVALGRGALMDIKLDAQSVSSRHAVFKAPGDGRARWCVVDTVSTNGTFVDGVRIATGREVELSEATVLRFGPDLRLAFYESSQLLQVLRRLARDQAAEPAKNRVESALQPAAAVAHRRDPDSGKMKQPPPMTPAVILANKNPIETILDEALVDTEVVARSTVPSNQNQTHKEPPGHKTEAHQRIEREATQPLKAPANPQRASSGAVARPVRPLGGPGVNKKGIDKDEVGTKTETDLHVPTIFQQLQQKKGASDEAIPRTPASGPASLSPEAVVVLSCEPFAPLALELHRPIVIGRVPGNDFVLPNPQVSRRHCEVERIREGVVVRDLKSANGTYFEDRRIDRVTVPFGGVFRIGPYALEVRSVEPAHSSAPNFGDTMISAASKAAEGLRGTFEDMPLTEMLSGVEFNQKTGVIDIQGDDGTAGFVSFRGGAPHQSRCGKLEGEQAILALLAIKHGRFILRSDEAAVGPREIECGFTKVLLEHGRISDEASKKK